MSETELNPWQKELSNWIVNYMQQNKASFADTARYLGINSSTLDDYRRRRTKKLDAISDVTRMQLYEKTKIEELKVEGYVPRPETKTESSMAGPELAEYEGRLKRMLVKNRERSIRDIEDTFYLLIEGMDFLKTDEAGRKMLQKTLPKEDVGYLTSLFNAIYTPDGFKEWILFYSGKPRKRSR